jgi:molecular chaperone DnaK (HSP70)
MDIFAINFHGNYVLQPRFSLGIDLGTSNSAVAL